MRTIRHILWTIAVCALFASCTRDPDVRVFSTREGVPVQMRFNLLVVDPAIETRSRATSLTHDGQIRDLNIFVFNTATGVLDGYAYASQLTGGTGTQCTVSGTSGVRTLAVIANAGQQLGGSVAELSDLEGLSTGNFIVDGYVVMAGTLPDVDVYPPGDPDRAWVFDAGEILLQRLMSKVTVVFDKTGLSPDYTDFDIDIQSIQLKQVPAAFTYLTPNTPTAGFADGDYIGEADGPLEPADHDSAIPLYMAENMQGSKDRNPADEHYLLGDTLDLGLRYSSSITMVPRDTVIGRCSYVEILARYDNYKAQPQGNTGSIGTVKYKIFLGRGLGGTTWNNFDVRRNTWYKVTVTLKDEGGKLELSWRIDTSDLEHFSPDDPDDPDPDNDPGSYAINDEDALYWTVDTLAPALLQWSNPSQLLKVSEYYEGRWSMYRIAQQAGNIGNFYAANHCHQHNASNAIDDIIFYLPSQNELQMLNIHRNATFQPGIYWSSTQLQEGSNVNQRARVINYANFGEAYTQPKEMDAIVRCLRTPIRSADWDGRYYPRLDNTDGYPVVVNREDFNGEPRGVKAYALRTGMPYTRLTPYYHRVTMPYKAFRVAKSDCGLYGAPVTPGTERLNWYQAMGYVEMSETEQQAAGANYLPQVNPTPTGCDAYFEDNDPTQIGKWRVPTSLELQQLWIMGASTRGSRPADPTVTPYLNAANEVNARLSGITDLGITDYEHVFGDNSTLLDNTMYLVGPDYPVYPLTNCYWSASTTVQQDGSPYENNAYAYKMDLYSGDGYSGIETCLARPGKQEAGLVRCVMDVVR